MKLCFCMFYILFFGIGFASGDVSLDDEFIVVDGIRVRKSEQMKVRIEQKGKEEQRRIKDRSEEEDARLYNESKDITKHLPNKCQGWLINKLLVLVFNLDLKLIETNLYLAANNFSAEVIGIIYYSI